MRAFQFWVLMVGSLIISGLLVKQIFLNREIYFQQRILVDDEETASDAARYEEAWNELAVAVYTSSRQDPVLAGILKDENVGISPAGPDVAAPNLPSQATSATSSKMPSSMPPAAAH